MIEKLAYFDNAATTYIKPQEVHDFMYSFYKSNSVNIGRGMHCLLNTGAKLVADTRSMVLDLFCASNAYQTVFTPTATEAINVILQGQNWERGDNIYITPFEHNAVYRTLKFLEKTKEINIIELVVDKNSLKFDLEKIRYQFIDEKPKCVIVTHVSNVCGNIVPIDDLGKLAKEFRSAYVLDCAQSAGLLDINIIKNMADYLVFAGHKTLYGPFGCSGFVCKNDTSLLPLIYGGTGIDSASEEMPKTGTTRFEAGSQNLMAIAGLNASLNWSKSIGISNIRERENANYNKLKNVLSSYNFIKLVGNSENATSIVSCKFDGLSADNVGIILSKNGVIVRTGLLCSPLAHKFLGTFPEGTVRFSVSYFTSDEDFYYLSQVLDLIQENL